MLFQTNYGVHTNLEVFSKPSSFVLTPIKTTPVIAAQKRFVFQTTGVVRLYSLALITRGAAPGYHNAALSGL
jgi:hypothetical protein